MFLLEDVSMDEWNDGWVEDVIRGCMDSVCVHGWGIDFVRLIAVARPSVRVRREERFSCAPSKFPGGMGWGHALSTCNVLD